MKSRQEFIERWRVTLAGLALYGHTTDVKGTTEEKVGRALKITEIVEGLLSRIYADLAGDEAMRAPPANGVANGRPHGAANGRAV